MTAAVLAVAGLAWGCGASEDAAAPRPSGTAPGGDQQVETRPEAGGLGDIFAPKAVGWVRPGPSKCVGPAKRPHGYFLYFTCARDGHHWVYVTPARKLAVESATPTDALALLLAGPDAEEKRAGFISVFSSDSANVPFTVTVDGRRALAIVDLDKSIFDRPILTEPTSPDLNMFISQIVVTVGQFPEINGVAIQVGGKPLCTSIELC